MTQKFKHKVRCAICGTEGEIETIYRFENFAICEFCFLNMRAVETIDRKNKFYMEG